MTSSEIQCDQYLAHSPAVVWKALTEPDLLARWWAPGDIKPVLGHRFTLDMGPWGDQPCEVTAVDPERLLAYTFAEDSLNTTITWRLVSEGIGTRLFLEHSGFDLDSPLGRQAVEGMGNGWPSILRHMGSALAGVQA